MVTIKASDVQVLRERTNVGMLDCKKALEEANGDIEKAIIVLREKGIAKAAKRADKEAKEGQVYSYIHPGNKLGVLIEINCETDFVARTEDFTKLVKEFAMQVAATNPVGISKEDVPQDKIEQELEIAKKQLLAEGKPANIIEKIIPGKLEKYYSEVCLLEQTSVKNPAIKMKDILNDYKLKTGENLIVRRFVRFQLGEN
jgi:elongation factor Ts